MEKNVKEGLRSFAWSMAEIPYQRVGWAEGRTVIVQLGSQEEVPEPCRNEYVSFAKRYFRRSDHPFEGGIFCKLDPVRPATTR
jgi:hypothetical protein